MKAERSLTNQLTFRKEQANFKICTMENTILNTAVKELLHKGTVIPAHPLVLDENRMLDEERQRRLTRYYIASGAGGVAVGVHTTQFAIRDPEIGLFRPVLELAAEEANGK